MASLWNMLREEVLGTVDDFRQKGAIGALRDAALDTKDLALETGGWLVGGVKGLVAENEAEGGMSQAYVVGPEVPKRGSTVMLCLPDGNLVEATTLDVDGVSEPPRVRVTAPGMDEPMLVPVLDPAAAEQMKEAAKTVPADDGARVSVFEGLKQELNSTVQDFREKGAIGAMKDAALDAVDMVGSTAKTAVSGARSIAEPCVQEFREKGAVGAVKDAALDAVDMVGSTAKTAVNGARSLAEPCVQDARVQGAVGAVKGAALDAVDLLGSTAQSAVSGAKSIATPLIDFVTEPDTPEGNQPAGQSGGTAPADRSAAPSGAAPMDGSAEGGSLLDDLKQEWNGTVQDFREKGAVGAVKDAALDAVDLVGSTATTALGAASTAIQGARARAAPLIEQVSGSLPDLWSDPAEAGAMAGAQAAAASAQAEAAGVPAFTGPTQGAAASSSSSPSSGGAAASRPSQEARAPEPAPESAQAPAAEAAAAAPAATAGQAPAVPAVPAVPEVKLEGAEAPAVISPVSMATPRVGSESSTSGSKAAGRKSLVSMRRNMFEKPKEEEKKESEELID